MDSQERKPKKDRELAPDLLTHIQSLGLATVADYVGWCVRHGFSRRLDKHWRGRLRERSYARRTLAEARLTQKRREMRRPGSVIQKIFDGELGEDDVAQPHLKALCRACKSPHESRSTRLALQNLLTHVGACSNLLGNGPAVRQFGWQPGNTLIDALWAVARHSGCWKRLPAAWTPRSHNARRQFASLVRHLFAEWPVPAFMDSAWFLGNGRTAVQQQRWFIHVARGQNIREADLPLAYTKRMAHCFVHAPADLTIAEALRWGQVHGLGGSARLARAVTGTRLTTSFEHDEFWTTVLRFFIANPMLDLAHIGPIVDYIHHERFEEQDLVLPGGAIESRGAAQPNFTMKGRSPVALLRQVEAWHRTLARVEQPKAQWRPSGISGFEFIEGAAQGGNLRIWTITELLSSKALADEGRKMKHCVASYARSCAAAACSIWSLEVETLAGRDKVLTVEVRNAARLICQARGKCNAQAAEKHRGILRRWADTAGLSLAKFV